MRAGGGPEPGDHQPAFPEQGPLARRDAALHRPTNTALPCVQAAAVAEVRPRPGCRRSSICDFQPQHLQRDKLAALVCVLGRAPIQANVSAHLRRARQVLRRSECASCAHGCVSRAPIRDVDPALVADGLSALTDGLWLDLLVRPESMSRELARRISMIVSRGCAFRVTSASRDRATHRGRSTCHREPTGCVGKIGHRADHP